MDNICEENHWKHDWMATSGYMINSHSVPITEQCNRCGIHRDTPRRVQLQLEKRFKALDTKID